MRFAKKNKSALGCGLVLLFVLLAGMWHAAVAQVGTLSPRTSSINKKSNQSKVFYYDHIWWAVAFDSVRAAWHMWKYEGGNWTRKTGVQNGADYTPDAVLDSTAGKLYVFTSHDVKPYIRRYSYSGETWVKDSGFPRAFAGFLNADGNNPINMVKAKNGYLWIFRIANFKLQAKYSANQGQNWSKIITIKQLTHKKGTVAAVAFNDGVSDFLGVGYGEAPTDSSSFGFVRHQDSEAGNVWTDETASITYLGTERGRNDVCMAADPANRVYMFTRTIGGAPADPRNTLYIRNPSGNWTPFLVNPANGAHWNSPAIAMDTENGRIHVMGTNVNNGRVEYKTGLLGLGSDLQNAPVQELFPSGANVFQDVSVPSRGLDATTDMMITVGNVTQNDTWFNLANLPATVPLNVNAVALNNYSVNANCSYTLSLTTSSYGNLVANFSAITVRFPNNTAVPGVFAPGLITVNGVAVTAATSNISTRRITLTTPVDIDNSTNFTIVFSAALGILNPTLSGAYKLNAWTSSQPLVAASPNYNLNPANTTISHVTATPFSANVDSTAQYTVGFRTGNNGRLFSGNSTITMQWEYNTHIMAGVLTGVTLNGVAAAATGDQVNRRVVVTVPAAVTINNNDTATVVIPATAVTNPSYVDIFQLVANTSVEPAQITSNDFHIFKGRAIAGTAKNFEHGNQSKMFYHDGCWWVAAQSQSNNLWYLWKRSDTTWTQTALIHTSGTKFRPDCILDAASNRVYILLPGHTVTSFTRMSYAAGAWSVDNGYPTNVITLQDSRMNIVRSHNGNLWVFWIKDTTLFARRSTTDGLNWGSTVIVKDSLHTDAGLTDAVPFSNAGHNYIGLGYAENSDDSSSVFGFLRHDDNDGPSAWVDESATVPQFSGTLVFDRINMLVHNNEIFMAVKTEHKGDLLNGLLLRQTNGTWSSYPISVDKGWPHPVLAIDATNNRIYAFGTRTLGAKFVEGKSVSLGAYNGFASAPTDTIMRHYSDDFFEVSSPGHVVNGTSNLLIAAANTTRNETWVQLIDLPGVALAVQSLPPVNNQALAAQTAMSSGDLAVSAYPNPMNPSTHIQFTLNTAAPVKLQIFNINGQLVKTLVNNDLAAGTHRRLWRGTNQSGQTVSSGVYFYNLQAGSVTKTGRLYMLK